MVELIKSMVKCYKKKTKKMVGGRRKTYEYYQYQVPLKKSDNLPCSEEVFIIPQNQFEELIEAEIGGRQNYDKQYQGIIAEYEKELAELEWKHDELSKSYKTLVSKNAKTNKRLRLEGEKIKTLEQENEKLQDQLQHISNEYHKLKISHKDELKKNKQLMEEIKSEEKSGFWGLLQKKK